MVDYDPSDEIVWNDDTEPGLCPHCAGSGEGYSDGSTCSTCKGNGEV